MPKKRVYEIAKEYEIPGKEFVGFLNDYKIPVKNHMSVLTDDQVETIKGKFKDKDAIRKFRNNVKKKQVKPDKAKQSSENSQKEKEVSEKNRQAKPEAQEKRSRNRNTARKKPEQRQSTSEARETAKHTQENKASGESGEQENKTGNRRRRRRRNRNRNKKPAEAQGTNQNRTTEKQTQERPKRQSKPSGNKPKPAAKNFSAPQPNIKNKNKQKKKRKNYHEKKAERPIKIRDNSKKTKSKRVDYRKQREERKADQRKNRVYEIPELITVGKLAEILDLGSSEIISTLMQDGIMASINQQIDADTAQIVASEFGYEVVPITTEDVVEKIFEDYDNLETGKEIKRPPVVTVMGHVDHGKTSLLDKIRKTNVTAGEAGGITQHIGAYTVKANNEQITFIDTPGHAAFTAMRSRGAQMTDIAVLVVAADDGVMPQTVEAINHARAAEVPIIVAINKIDKEGANPERVKQELTEQNILVEEWGGDVIAVPISARQGTNIEELLENILLVAEVEELKADPNRKARGSVIEAEVKKGKGATASLLIQSGTLHVGDTLLSGTTYGKVRTMIDDKGKRIRKAGPSMPVEISGFSEIPEAGDDFIVLEDEKEARSLAEQRKEMQKLKEQQKRSVSLNDLYQRIQEGQISDVNIIVKADVNGSVEAISQSLERLNTDEVRVNVIHGAVGAVNETDVMLASTSNAIIIAFNVRADHIAKSTAEREEVDVRYYSVIYDAIEDVKKAMEGLLEPEFVENLTGEAEVREVFKIPGGTVVAGSYVTDGKVTRGTDARLIRDGVVVYQGKVASLRRFKDDVKEVLQGFECGIGIENMNDIKVGDVIETFEIEAVKREL